MTHCRDRLPWRGATGHLYRHPVGTVAHDVAGLHGREIDLAFWALGEQARHRPRPLLEIVALCHLLDLHFEGFQIRRFLLEDHIGRAL